MCQRSAWHLFVLYRGRRTPVSIQGGEILLRPLAILFSNTKAVVWLVS
jgi:hypothetical protein